MKYEIGDEVLVTVKSNDNRLIVGTEFLASVIDYTCGNYLVKDQDDDVWEMEERELTLNV